MQRGLVACFAALVTACGSDSSALASPSVSSIAGSYTMRTVNGSPLPFTIQSGATKSVLTNDVLTVADDGTWTESVSVTTTVNGTTASQVAADEGTYTRAGAAVTFTSSHGSPAYVGTYSDGGFTVSDGTFVYTFSK